MFLNRPQQLVGCVVLGLSLLLSGCGFQLRGTGVDNIKLDEIRVSSNNPFGATHRQLVEALEVDGVRISDSAAFTLQLIEEGQERRAVTYTARSTPAEYELSSLLRFQISDAQGRALVGPETLTTQRIFVNDKDNIIGTGEEESWLRREMQRDLTRQLLFRLSSMSEGQLQARERALNQAP